MVPVKTLPESWPAKVKLPVTLLVVAVGVMAVVVPVKAPLELIVKFTTKPELPIVPISVPAVLAALIVAAILPVIAVSGCTPPGKLLFETPDIVPKKARATGFDTVNETVTGAAIE